MDLTALSLSVLLTASNWLSVSNTPAKAIDAWRIEENWNGSGSVQEFKAVNTGLVSLCNKYPNGYIEFPAIIHAAQNVFLDGRLVFEFGDRSFSNFRSFYGAPLVSCSLLQGGTELKWEAYSYSKYFARFSFFPRFSLTQPASNFFQETINVIAAGFLLLMAIINLIIFFGKIPSPLAVSFAFSNLFFAGFFFFAVASFFGVHMPKLRAHILADSCIFVGVALFFNTLRIRGLISERVLLLFVAIKLVSLFIFYHAKDGDTVQFATTLTFPLALNLILWSMVPLIKNFRAGVLSRGGLLQFISLTCFVGSIINDILLVLGVFDTYPLMAVGSVGTLVFASLSLNEHLIATYMERDYLRQNLELEVERKTFELRKKSFELEKAMSDLKYTQAELVQSAKLASLGTLSAGIAHEINNSLNYVQGAIQPLESLIDKDNPGIRSQKMKNLLKVMREGLKVTFDIMESLRNFSGLNQAKFNDVNLLQVIRSVLTILRAKIPSNINVRVKVADDVSVFGNVVGLNQTFMNLVVNAIDAMPGGGELSIFTNSNAGFLEVSVMDTGIGMSQAVLDRALEPFFTTKDVGRGSGLGLHIVRQELERHQGKIHIQTKINQGTIVTVSLPMNIAATQGLVA